MAKKTKNPKTEQINVCRRQKDRREQGSKFEAAQTASNPAASDTPPRKENRKVVRRRQIDPTTCERDYTEDEIEFMQAMDAYKRSSGRMFPTCSEILEVVRGMGYLRPGIDVASIDVIAGEDDLQEDAGVEAEEFETALGE